VTANSPVRFGSVCSGIEAASVAWRPLGWEAAWFSEIEPFPCAMLAYHYPDVPNLGDMTTLPHRIRSGEVEAPEVFCGGTPCQAFSIAGMRRSLDDARGNLSLTFVEIADAVDAVRVGRGERPCVVFWENVPGVLSTADNAFGCFLAGLAGEDVPLEPPGSRWSNAGAVLGPSRAIAWRVLDAQHFGLAQRRKRVFVVASARGGFDPTAVLLEFHGVRRDTAPRREAGKDASGSSGDGVARCVTTGEGKRQDWESCTMIAHHPTHSLRGEGFDASEDGTGRGTPLVPVAFHPTQDPISSEDGTTHAMGCGSSGGQASVAVAVAQPLVFDTTQISSPANYSSPKSGDPCHPLAAGAHPPAVALQDVRAMNKAQKGCGWNDEGAAYTVDTHATQGVAVAFPIQECHVSRANLNGTGTGLGDDGDPMFTLQAAQPHGVAAAMQVRRLTPVECERLQGFPDGYTAIPWRKKPAADCPDGPRYKALGNSWAVPVVRWVGRRIDGALKGEKLTGGEP
jgi:DNA (cytosine-5)-methyltransferase 1